MLVDSICWWWAHRDDLDKNMEACGNQEAGFHSNMFLQPAFQQFRTLLNWHPSSKSPLQPILNLAFQPFYDTSIVVFKFRYIVHVYIIYINIPNIDIYLLTQWKGRWFFSNFRSDHFGRFKVARRSERGGGKKPQVQEKVPCRAMFFFVAVRVVFGFWKVC